MELNTYDTWEGQVIEVKKGNHLPKPVIIGNIYRPPKDLIDKYQEFITELSPILGTLGTTNKEVIIAGDYNIDLLKINHKPIFSEYFDMLTSYSFYPKITLPTRFTTNHATLIDNFFCKLTEATLNTTSGILAKQFSDHQPYFTLLHDIRLKVPPPKFIRINKQDTEAINHLHNEILKSDLINNLVHNPIEDPNINYNILHDVIENAKNKHMPHKIVKFNRYKHKKSKWITKGILKSIEFRDNLYKKYKMTDPNTPLYVTLKTNLATYNTILKKNIRIAQKDYYENLFNKFKNDIRGTWKTINEILCKTKKKKSFPQFFKDNETVITNKLTIANKFNTFFTNIGPKLADQIKMPKNKHFKNYLTLNYNHKFTFKDIDEEGVRKIIERLAPKTSFGFDGLSTKLIKEIKDCLVKPLTLIINQMLNTGIFPDKLKIAKIAPAHKKDDETLFTNYRPISLLPAISKIFEKVIFKQLYDFFQLNKLFYNSQYGFRTEHSTEYAALELIDRVLVEMDKNDMPINIFLDLSKAFDTLDHNILLHKLSYYGVKGIALNLFESYLTNRKQFVQIDDIKSETLTIKTGVPQGSILGPLLFIIYINDIALSSKVFDFIIYADDTTLSGTLKIIIKHAPNINIQTTINNELQNINDWLKTNKLSLNVKKSKFMIFHTPQRKIDPIEIKIDGTVIERVAEFNFLGIILNENMTWNSHANKIANKISRSIGILNKLKHFLPIKTKILIYNSLIQSHLNYGILAWGYKCDRIIKLQKKAVRILCIRKYRAHTEPLFKEMKLLKIQDIMTLQQLKFYYKYKHNRLPHYLQHLPIIHNRDIHTHETRARDNIHTIKTNHEYARSCIRYNLPKLINTMPNVITDKINTHSLSGFYGYAKNYLLNAYQDTCTIDNCYICSRV